jgi:hypothetical protein
MLGLIANGASLVFPGGKVVKLLKNGVAITNSINPLVLAKNITLTVLYCCAPPPVRLAYHCVATVALIRASVAAPNPVTIGSSIRIVTKLYDLC